MTEAQRAKAQVIHEAIDGIKLTEKQRFINKNTEMMKGLQLYDANARKKPVNFILRLKSAFLDLT